MVISNDELRASFFSTVYDVINDNYPDPEQRGKQWIFSTMPDTLAANFIGFPIIVINKARISKDHELFDNSWSDKSTPVIITIYSTNNATVDAVSDGVDKVITPSNLPQFKFNDYKESDGNTDLGQGTLHFRTMTYSVELMQLVQE